MSCVAPRIHIAVSGATGPNDRYSAMPSTNQSGIAAAAGLPRALPVAPLMSY